MVEFTELEQIWFVVSPKNPFKEKESLLNEKHRIRMVRIAIEYDNRFRASPVEFDMPRPSYTIDTLNLLSHKYPQHDFSLIMGLDNLSTLHKWKDYKEILKGYRIYIYPRANYNTSPVLATHKSVIITQAPVVEISSTFIRNAIAEGKTIKHFVTPAVSDYIKQMHFYE